eukprot:TRINITY_DN34019_c0_g1_i1.p2 TRINITY_DN34019_c0_g1~~TRINITY_DN34019_c0_g1_i1.p2  ORF type:complete len:202 (-),score=35.92 TRINITY_DN34019_c0_g1_i1:358-963(-)
MEIVSATNVLGMLGHGPTAVRLVGAEPGIERLFVQLLPLQLVVAVGHGHPRLSLASMKSLALGECRLGQAAANCAGMACSSALSHVLRGWMRIVPPCLHDRQIKTPALVRTAPGKLMAGDLASSKPAARVMGWVTMSVMFFALSRLQTAALAPPRVKLNHVRSRTVLSVLVDGCPVAGQVVKMRVDGPLNISRCSAFLDLA